MKRSLALLGLVWLLGCEGADAEEPSSDVTTAAFAETGDQRVGRFELLPESAIARKSIEPQAWSRGSGAIEHVEETRIVGRFDPAMVREAEAYRRSLGTTGGVR